VNKMNGSKEKKERNLKIAAIALSLVFLVSAILLVVNIWESRETNHDNDSPSEDIEFNGVKYQLKDGLETILVLGLDKYESNDAESYNNDKQADFLMLFVVDHENENCTVLHINRDTMAEMDILGVAGDSVGTVVQQIALAHTYGDGKEQSCHNVADAVSRLLMNVEIDHTASVTMDAVAVYNDFIGGVEIDEVLDDFSGIDDTLVKGEPVILRGEHALNYVRTRYGLDDSTNMNRMIRQRQYIEALYKKTLECIESDDSFVTNAALKLSNYVVSDYTGTGLQDLAKKIMHYDFVEISELEGETIAGDKYIEFYADENSIQETVIKMFYEEK